MLTCSRSPGQYPLVMKPASTITTSTGAGQPLVVPETGEIVSVEAPGRLFEYARPTGLDLPDGLDFEEWEAVGGVLCAIEGSVMWWLGDWWRYGERAYGEAASAAAPTGYSAETCRKAAWVADKFPESVLRRTDLSFKHHQTVAALDPPERDALLGEAVAERWSVAQLTDAVKHRKQRAKEQAEIAARGLAAAFDPFHCSVADLVDHVEPGSVDVFITDPPYPAEYLSCYSDLSHTAAKLLKPGGLCVAMAGQSYLPEIYARLGEALSYHWTIGYLTPGGQAVQLWDRHVNTFWKPVLVYSNGSYDGDWFGDVARSDVNDNDKDHHHWGQSESGMADLIRRVSAAGDLVCDPFLGGGTTAVVAAQLGRRVVGCDIDADALDVTRQRFA